MTLKKMHEGLNQSAVQMYVDDNVAGAADNANWTIQLPADVVAQAALPIVKAVVTYGAGAAGARTATYYPVVDTGSGLVGIEVVSFVETTGVLTLTNRSGGAMANIRTIIQVMSDTE